MLGDIKVVIGTGVSYYLLFQLNSMLFSSFSYATGVDWIFLPSGLRLVFILIFLENGAVGIAIASALISYISYFGPDLLTAIGAGVISGISPLLAMKFSLKPMKISANFEKMNGRTLFKVALVFALMSATLHQTWFLLRGQTESFLSPLFVMTVGDMLGSLLLLYFTKYAINVSKCLLR